VAICAQKLGLTIYLSFFRVIRKSADGNGHPQIAKTARGSLDLRLMMATVRLRDSGLRDVRPSAKYVLCHAVVHEPKQVHGAKGDANEVEKR